MIGQDDGSPGPGKAAALAGTRVMWFPLKAIFWLGLVFLLLPSPEAGRQAPPRAGATAGEASTQERIGALCADRIEACLDGARLLMEGARTVERFFAPDTSRPSVNTLTRQDLHAPFGGFEPPRGEAPTRAPLPPRRPA